MISVMLEATETQEAVVKLIVKKFVRGSTTTLFLSSGNARNAVFRCEGKLQEHRLFILSMSQGG